MAKYKDPQVDPEGAIGVAGLEPAKSLGPKPSVLPITLHPEVAGIGDDPTIQAYEACVIATFTIPQGNGWNRTNDFGFADRPQDPLEFVTDIVLRASKSVAGHTLIAMTF